MANTDFTPEQLKVLKENFAKGVLRVREADLTLDFTDGKDMKARIDAIEKELIECGLIQTNANASTGIRTTRARYSGRISRY